MDNLERDVRMAEKLGYGCHYGWYKADHPHTADLTDDEILGLPQRNEKPKPKEDPDMTVCRYCGKSFPKSSYGRQFCDDYCRRYYYERRKRERKKGEMRDGKVCAICGKPIATERNRKYCSDNCREVGNRERYQFYLAQQKVKRDRKRE